MEQQDIKTIIAEYLFIVSRSNYGAVVQLRLCKSKSMQSKKTIFKKTFSPRKEEAPGPVNGNQPKENWPFIKAPIKRNSNNCHKITANVWRAILFNPLREIISETAEPHLY
jgi:hypothetical protein